MPIRQWFAPIAVVLMLTLVGCGADSADAPVDEPQPAGENGGMAGEEDGAEVSDVLQAADDGSTDDQDEAGAPGSGAAQGDASGADANQPTSEGRLEQVLARGELICGVNDQLPGFGFVDSDGEYAGFDVDFCKAIAAAVLGDAEAVTYRALSAQQRFTALQTGEVDVLVRNTTWTLTRDTQNGLDFGPTTFYDGQGIMTRVELEISALEDLAGASICVGSGTTTERNLGDVMREAGVAYDGIVFEGADQVFGAYDSGRCDAVTADRSALVTRKPTLATPDEHEILDLTLSKEPLGPAVLQGDHRWADVVNWVVFGVIQAEEFGITTENLDEQMESDNPEVRRFLGLEDALGEGLGINNAFMVDVVGQVGNYAEIYERNLGSESEFDLARGVNRLWTDGGLLYAPPFR